MSSVCNYLNRSTDRIMDALTPPISPKTALMLKIAGLVSVMALATIGETGHFFSNIAFTAFGSAYVFHVVERLEMPRSAEMLVQLFQGGGEIVQQQQLE